MKVIFGSSGHAKEMLWTFRSINERDLDYFIDIKDVGNYVNNVPIISLNSFLRLDYKREAEIFLGFGNSKLRQKVLKNLLLRGYQKSNFPNLVHNNCILGSQIVMGYGCYLAAHTLLTTNITIGDFVHINTNSTVSHDCIIGSFSTISPNVCLCGNVNLGEHVFLGANSVVIECKTILNNVFIGAGSTVTKNLLDEGVYFGNPARRCE